MSGAKGLPGLAVVMAAAAAAAGCGSLTNGKIHIGSCQIVTRAACFSAN